MSFVKLPFVELPVVPRSLTMRMCFHRSWFRHSSLRWFRYTTTQVGLGLCASGPTHGHTHGSTTPAVRCDGVDTSLRQYPRIYCIVGVTRHDPLPRNAGMPFDSLLIDASTLPDQPVPSLLEQLLRAYGEPQSQRRGEEKDHILRRKGQGLW